MYNENVIVEFDPGKDDKNQGKHGISLAAAEDFEWEGAFYALDNRKIYGEWRITAVGYLYGRLHVVIFTERCGIVRIISLRKANTREVKDYETRSTS